MFLTTSALAVFLEVLAQAVLHGFLELLVAVAAGIAHAHLGLLALLAALFVELPASLFGEGRDAYAYYLAVVLGHYTQIAVDNSLLDDLEHILVPGLDGYGACVGCGHSGAVVDRYHGTVVVYADTIQQFHISFSGTYARQ